jgi:DNA-binding response OmpR family regulator
MNPNATVLIVGRTTLLPDLAAHLPRDWRIQRAELTVGARADIVLLVEPDPAQISRVALDAPEAAVIAVLSPFSDQDEVVRVLEAGADACVRTQNAAIVAAHVEACRRRQLTTPWHLHQAA